MKKSKKVATEIDDLVVNCEHEWECHNLDKEKRTIELKCEKCDLLWQPIHY